MRFSVITPTHDAKYLAETWESVRKQTVKDWEWVICPNAQFGAGEPLDSLIAKVKEIVGDDSRVRIIPDASLFTGIGARKHFAFHQGEGDILVELDHDDMLTEDALEELDKAFQERGIDFVYSNFADFLADGSPSTFGPTGEKNGWQHRKAEVDGKFYMEAIAWEPTAAALSYIWYAPNHVRAWSRDFYRKIGGHDVTWPIADDHELLVRTYLKGRMKKIDKLLYLYRMGDNNTWSKQGDEIARRSRILCALNVENLVKRECELKQEPLIDLGGGFSCPKGWTACDVELDGEKGIQADLNEPWPFKDGSVGAFRAHDFLEHIADKQHVMKEIHRCLRPGGYLLSFTPSTDGRGAFQDPTHVAYWNENSFWYYTQKQQARYIRNDKVGFIAHRLCTDFPGEFERAHNISYVYADLIAYKGDMSGIPGVRDFN